MEWKQERPSWCPQPSCKFKRRAQDACCVGILQTPQPHDVDFNIYNWCMRFDDRVDRYEVNDSDLGQFRWLFDALDGKTTSWLSDRSKPHDLR